MEEKTRARVIAAALLLLFTLPSPGRSQETEKQPRWLKPTLVNSHSVPADGEELLSRDFSPVLSDKRIGFIGYIGNDYYKMDICFHTVTKESDTSYRITGSSKVRTNVCTFAGSVRITDVRELNEPEYGTDDFMRSRIKRQGVCIARYRLEESRQQKGSGVFSGISIFRWYIDETDRLHYDDVNEDADGKLRSETWYAMKRKNGVDRTYDCETGKVIIEQYYKNDELHGKSLSYVFSSDGKDAIERTVYERGRQNGEYSLILLDGTVCEAGYFKNGRRSGEWLTRDVGNNKTGMKRVYEGEMIVEQEDIDDFDEYIREHRPEL